MCIEFSVNNQIKKRLSRDVILKIIRFHAGVQLEGQKKSVDVLLQAISHIELKEVL